MPVIVAPSTQPVPNGYSNPRNELVEFVLNTGDRLNWSVTGSQAGGPGSTHEYGFYLHEQGTNRLVHTMSPDWGQALSTSYQAAAPLGGLLTLQIGGNAFNAATGTAFGVFAEIIPAAVTASCVYGTQRKFGVPSVLTLTPDQIVALLTAGGWSWLRNAVAFLDFSQLNVEALCQAGPPPLPEIDTTTITAGVVTWTRIFHAVIWSQLCECVPGTPSPIPFPIPTGSPPSDWPPTLTFSCDPADICAALVNIQQQLAAILQTSGSTLELATLQQRYEAPFAYIRGARHSSLSGTGAFAVPRLIGVLVEVTTIPEGRQTFSGAPAYITDLGWISTLDGNGMLDEVRLTRQAQVWFPASAQAATTLGYALREDVVADIVELYAEP